MRGAFDFGRSVPIWRKARLFLGGPRSGGFTMIEVMIVLAVTGALFVSAAIVIAGRQNQTAFDQSIRQIQSQIQQTINDVSVGFFPEKGTFKCNATGSGPVLSPGGSGQGTNDGCIFLGKALQFQVGATSPEEFTSYTIAGLQQGSAGGAESSSLADAKPVVVAHSVSHSAVGYPNNSVTDELQNGLTTARMWYNNGGSDVEIGSVAFVHSLDEYVVTGGTITSGANQVDVVPVAGTALGANRQSTVQTMNADGGNAIATSALNPSGGVFICFKSGGTKQYGIIKIGGTNRDLTVTLRIKNDDGSTCSNA